MQDRTHINYESLAVSRGGESRGGHWFFLVCGQLVIAFIVIVLSVVICAIGGGLIGRAIAALCPLYYPSVFYPASTCPGFDPVEAGVGTGVGQGAGVGVVVGLILVLALAIANWRRIRPRV